MPDEPTLPPSRDMLNDQQLARMQGLMRDPKPPKPAAPKAITQLGKYAVLKRLGPTAFQVSDGRRPRPMVMRILGTARDPAAVDGLIGELKQVAALRHPVFTGYHKLSHISGNYFVLRDWIEGRSLEEAERPPMEALQIFYQVARAIEHAHEKRLAHGGIVPANVILDSGGRPYVTDFAMISFRSRFRAEDATMLPTASATRDVDALGSLFWSMLAGVTPSRITGATELPRLRSISDAIDAKVDVLARRLLLRSGRRIGTAHEIAEETGKLLTELPGSQETGELLEQVAEKEEAKKKSATA